MTDKGKELKILGAPLGFWGFVLIPTVVLGWIFSVPWWFFAACLAVWTGLCAVIGWIGGEWRDKKE